MESEDVMTFCDTDFPRSSFAAFEDMRRSGEFCDIRIRVNDHHLVSAHRVILVAGIPYFRSYSGFRSMLTGNVVNEEWEVSLENLDPGALETLIHFAYTGRVNISTENVHSLLLASDFLQINQVRNACVGFLSNKINVSNVMEVRTLAHSLNHLTLVENSNRYIRENFEEFSKTDDFLNASDECIKEIIADDFLNVSCETVVLEAVIRWIKSSPSERQDILIELLSEVRLIYLPTGYLIKTLASEELINTSIPCRDIIEKAQSYHSLPKEDWECLNLKTQPRKSYLKGVIYGVHIRGSSVYYCDFTNSSWCRLRSKTVDRSARFEVEFAAVANGDIYIFREHTVERFGLKSLEWELLEPRHEDMRGAAVSAHGNVIYFFGSLHENFLDKMRRFDTLENNWTKEEKLKSLCCFSAATTLGDSIYVTGGQTNCPIRNHSYVTAQKYNVSTGQWNAIAAMNTPRAKHGCSNLNGIIYVCGGISDVEYFSSSAEMYDPLTDQWNAISSMNTGKFCVSLISCGNKIYALGGIKMDSEHADEFEMYDPQKDQWRAVFSIPREIQYFVV